MARPIQITFPAAVTTAVCTAQTTAGAGALTIDGTLKDLAATMQQVNRAVFGPGIQRVVSLTVAVANLSGVNVTIVGADINGVAVTETRVGPNNNTVFTTAEYATVTSVTVDGAVGTAMSVGSGDTGKTRWITNDMAIAPNNYTVALGITATASVTVQDTPDNVNTVAEASLTVFDHPTLVNKTASAESNFAYPPRFVRAKMNSSSGAGAFTFTIIQAGTN